MAWNSKTTYFYSELNPTYTPDLSEDEIHVYPNPSKEYVVFNITNISTSSRVEVYDMQGKQVLNQELAQDKRMAIHNLPKGIYLYKLFSSGNVYKGKIIVE